MFGKFRKPKQVYLRCPFCGNQQMEPFMAISSFCRECGEYFRIEKGLPVVKTGPHISGISEITERESSPGQGDQIEDEPPVDPESSGEPEEAPAVDAWLRSPGAHNQKTTRPLTTAPSEESLAEGNVGDAFFGLVDDAGKEEEKKPGPPAKSKSRKGSGAKRDSDETLGEDSESKEALAEGSMSALIGDITERNAFGADKTRMPANFVPPDQQEKGIRKKKNSKQIEVRCFRCNHCQQVSRYAASTQCGRCSVYITMSDYEIKGTRKDVLRTRGSVMVTRRASVIDTEIASHNFTTYGLVSAELDCTGDVIFKHSGKVKGQVHCNRLVVAKNCEVEFPDGVVADRADIYGKVRGNVTCKGKITVYKAGIIEGDARAEQVDVKGKGMVTGETSLEKDIDTGLSIKVGFNPSVIN